MCVCVCVCQTYTLPYGPRQLSALARPIRSYPSNGQFVPRKNKYAVVLFSSGNSGAGLVTYESSHRNCDPTVVSVSMIKVAT